MAGRGRRQRLNLDHNAPGGLGALSTIEDEFSKLLADVERIKAGPAPVPRATVLEDVQGAPGWVRVSSAPAAGPAPPPPPYYWNVATGQVSWALPQGQDAMKSLDMTRAVVGDAAAALAAGAPAAAPPARRAAAAEALTRLLDALGAEQRRGALEQMGTPASRVWCAVHSCVAAAVAALSAEAAAAAEAEAPAPKAQQEPHQPQEVQPPSAEMVAAEPAAAAEEEREEPAAKKRKGAGKAPSGVAAKGVASLMNRWAARQQEMAAEEEGGGGEEAAHEEWRADQLRAGAAGVNSNFAPVFGDWRDRVRAQQQQGPPSMTAAAAGQTSAQAPAQHAQPAAATVTSVPSAPAPAAAAPDLAALSAGLPPGWQAMWDPASGGVYYGNLATSQTQWHMPQ